MPGPCTPLAFALLLLGGAAARADETPPPGLDAARVDALVEALLGPDAGPPAPPCDDAAFLRRLDLDTLGTLPSPADLRAFLADPRPDKRRAWIAARLADPAWARRQAERAAERLLGERLEGPLALLAEGFVGWLAEAWRGQRGWDAAAGSLVAAEGRSDREPAALFALLHGRREPEALATAVSRRLLGVRLDCARCHDHPFQPVAQETFHSLTAWFARLRVLPDPDRRGVFQLAEAPLGEHRARLGGETREVAPAWPALAGCAAGDLPPGPPPPRTSARSRRAALARWLTSPGNALFARAAVNQVWADLFGRGLVEPVDDLGAADPADPRTRLLAALAADFARDGFQLPRLSAALLGSATWQRSAAPPATADSAEALRERLLLARVRPLDAATVTRALLALCGRDRPGPGEPPGVHQALVARLRAEVEAVLDPGGPPDPERVTTPQALLTLSGPAWTGLLRGAAARLVADPWPGTPAARQALGEELFLRALARPPRPAERALLEQTLSGDAAAARAGLEDLLAALAGTSEFLTNH